VVSTLLNGIDRDSLWSGPVVDVDVHANVPTTDVLLPYLDDVWVEWIRERNWRRGPAGASAHYPPASERAARNEWRGEGGPPASTVAQLQRDILEPWRTDTAIVTCYFGVESLRHPDWSAAMARAVNDWLLDSWVGADSRLKATMVLPANDPKAMIDEIRRVGDHPGFVQVLFPVRNSTPWGQRIYHDVYREIADRDLVVGLHYGGTTDGPPSVSGHPNWQVEQYAAEWQAFTTQITSLIAEGVFSRVPELRVSVLEGGFTWVPIWGNRMNKEWKALHREIPWVDRPPFDILRDHFRFSVAPTDLGPDKYVPSVLKWLGSDDLLMFATDYPHRHDDDIAVLLRAMSPEAQKKLMGDTARDWYRLT
jgi:predicted TIM-barrel fold metal-dependent hydrolase